MGMALRSIADDGERFLLNRPILASFLVYTLAGITSFDNYELGFEL